MPEPRNAPAPLAPLLALALLAGASACAGPERASSPVGAAEGPAPPLIGPPWTDAFLGRAVLVADQVRIEGPPGLLQHVATRPDPELHERSERATPDGFLQEVRVTRPIVGSEIQAWLDGLEIVALRRITVLERPGPCPVRVLAEGDVLWREIDGPGERRGPRLELSGTIGP
jgi:hypothetical protein